MMNKKIIHSVFGTTRDINIEKKNSIVCFTKFLMETHTVCYLYRYKCTGDIKKNVFSSTRADQQKITSDSCSGYPKMRRGGGKILIKFKRFTSN